MPVFYYTFDTNIDLFYQFYWIFERGQLVINYPVVNDTRLRIKGLFPSNFTTDPNTWYS